MVKAFAYRVGVDLYFIPSPVKPMTYFLRLLFAQLRKAPSGIPPTCDLQLLSELVMALWSLSRNRRMNTQLNQKNEVQVILDNL